MSYNYSLITERLFCGAQINSDADFDELKAAGVTHIIDAQAERDDNVFEPKNMIGLTILWDPQQDDGQHPKPVEWFKNAVEFGIGALKFPGTIVLTHCAAGYNRGPSLAYAILRAQGWSQVDAKALLHSRRSVGIAYADDADLALKTLGWTK